MKILALAIGFVVLLSMMGCTSLSTTQTARTLSPGDHRILLGGGVVGSPNFNERSSSGTTSVAGIPFLEGAIRLGVFERFDLGARLTLPGAIQGDLKYQILGDHHWALALGFGVSYLSVVVSSTSSSAQGYSANWISVKMLDFFVPFYVSYDVSDMFGLYLAPKYYFRTTMGSTQQTSNLVGGGFGLRFGNSAGAFIEAGYLKSLTESQKYSQFQANVAFFFGSGHSVPGGSESP